MREEFGVQRISKKLADRVYTYLEGELETYDDYLRGNVYGYKAEHPERGHIDGCYGFYGYDHEKSGLLAEAESMIEYDIRERETGYKEACRSHFNKLKQLIKNRVPLHYRPVFDIEPVIIEEAA